MEAQDLQGERRRRFREARRAVVKLGTSVVTGAGGEVSVERVTPVVNENDTVSTAELEYVGRGSERVFSDNDRLAALVMSKLESDALALLSDVDGLLVPRPPDTLSGVEHDEDSMVLPYVAEVTPELKALAAGPSATGRGGMLTKLEAAEIAMRAGCVAVIANGRRPDTLARVFAGEEVGTAFVPTSRMAGKRRWITYAAGVRGG